MSQEEEKKQTEAAGPAIGNLLDFDEPATVMIDTTQGAKPSGPRPNSQGVGIPGKDSFQTDS